MEWARHFMIAAINPFLLGQGSVLNRAVYGQCKRVHIKNWICGSDIEIHAY